MPSLSNVKMTRDHRCPSSCWSVSKGHISWWFGGHMMSGKHGMREAIPKPSSPKFFHISSLDNQCPWHIFFWGKISCICSWTWQVAKNDLELYRLLFDNFIHPSIHINNVPWSHLLQLPDQWLLTILSLRPECWDWGMHHYGQFMWCAGDWTLV